MDQKSEAECFNSLDVNQKYYYGKYWVFGKFRTNQYLFAIGPHWWVFILGFCFIFGMGMMIYVPLQEFIGFWYKLTFKILLFSLLFVYFLTFLINPGIIPVPINKQDLKDQEQNVKISCEKCQTPSTIKAEHCPDCDICILELDHHCVWTGKCIGKKNLLLFYIFVSLVPAFFVYVMFMAIQVSAKSEHKIKLKLIKNDMEMQTEIQNVINCLSNLNRQVRQNSSKKYTLNQYLDKLLNYIYIENLCLGKINNVTHDTEYACFSNLLRMFSKINKAYINNLVQVIMNIGDQNIFKQPDFLTQAKDRLSLGLKTQEKLNPSLFGEMQSIYNREYLQAFEKFFDNLGFKLSYAQRLSDYQTIFKENQNKQFPKKSSKKKSFCQISYERELLAQKIYREIEDKCYENFDLIKDPLVLIEISKIITKEMQKSQNSDFLNVIDEELIIQQTNSEKSSGTLLEEIATSFNFQFSVISQIRNVKCFQNLQTKNRALNDVIEQVYQKFLDFQRNLFKKIQKQQNEYLLKKIDKNIQTDQDFYTKELLEKLEDQKTQNDVLNLKLTEKQRHNSFLQQYQQQLENKYSGALKNINDIENMNEFQIEQYLETFHQNNIVKNHLQNLSRKLKKHKQSIQNFFMKSYEMFDKIFFNFDQNQQLETAVKNQNFDVQVLCNMMENKINEHVNKQLKKYQKDFVFNKIYFYKILYSQSIKKNIKNISQVFIIYQNQKINKKAKIYNLKKNNISQQQSIQNNYSVKEKPKKLQKFLNTKSDFRSSSQNKKQIKTFRNNSQKLKLLQNMSTKNIQKNNNDDKIIHQTNNKMTSNFPSKQSIQQSNKNTLYNMINDNQKGLDQNITKNLKKKLNQNNYIKDQDDKNLKLNILDNYSFSQCKNGQILFYVNQNYNQDVFEQYDNKKYPAQTSRDKLSKKFKQSKSQNQFFTFRKNKSFQNQKLNDINNNQEFKKSFRIKLNNNKIIKEYINSETDNIQQFIEDIHNQHQNLKNENQKKSKQQIQRDYEKIFEIYCKQLKLSEFDRHEQEHMKNKIRKLIRQFSEKHVCQRDCNHEKIFLKKLILLQKYLQNRKILKLPKYNITGQFLIK